MFIIIQVRWHSRPLQASMIHELILSGTLKAFLSGRISSVRMT